MGQLHSCGALSGDPYTGATVSHCDREQKKSGQRDPVAGCLLLPDECFCDFKKQGMERKAVGINRRH